MGMVITHDLTDNLGRFPVRPIRGEPHFVHPVQNPSMDRLEAVPHIGQCAPDDHAHGVIHIGRAHLVFDRNLS